jgi:hypothetical protein
MALFSNQEGTIGVVAPSLSISYENRKARGSLLPFEIVPNEEGTAIAVVPSLLSLYQIRKAPFGGHSFLEGLTGRRGRRGRHLVSAPAHFIIQSIRWEKGGK